MDTVFIAIEDGYPVRAFETRAKLEAWLKFEENEDRCNREDFDIYEIPLGS